MYEMRGNRVAPMQEVEISHIALNVSSILGFNKRNRKHCDRLFEQLSEYGIIIDPMSDKDWAKYTNDLTRGHFYPPTRTIRIPERIYTMACRGERDALFVMLHELGHLFLGHNAVLHNAKERPTRIEDAEWQADTFAERILIEMGYYVDQLSFDFYM